MPYLKFIKKGKEDTEQEIVHEKHHKLEPLKSNIPALLPELDNFSTNIARIEKHKLTLPRLVYSPLFIHCTSFQESLIHLDEISVVLTESQRVISSIENIKRAQDKLTENLISALIDTQEKLIFVDKIIGG